MTIRTRRMVLMLWAAAVCPNCPWATGQGLPGFHGQVVEMGEVAGSQPEDVSAAAPTAGDIDLTAMAARSETCAVADVIDMAACMAQCGYPDYWDAVERFIRNYIHEAQFFVTPEYEKLYRSLHPGEAGDRGLAMARDFEGGFQGAMGISDRCFDGATMDMMGCCLPEGMRAIHTAWRNTVTREKTGVHVNMCFNRDAPEATVVSFLPRQGRMTVAAKVAADFSLRPPAWTPRERVKVYRNGLRAAAPWRDAHVVLEKVVPGEVLTMTWPVLRIVQKQAVKSSPGQADRELTVTWLGNTVVKLEPPGGRLPLYRNRSDLAR